LLIIGEIDKLSLLTEAASQGVDEPFPMANY